MALMPFGLRIQAVTFKFFRGTMAINSLVKINDLLTVEASVGQLRSCLKIILSFYMTKREIHVLKQIQKQALIFLKEL